MADIEQRTGQGPRGRYRDLDLASNDQDNKAYAPYMSLAPAQPLGHYEFVVSPVPTGPPVIPVGAKRAVFFCRSEITFTDDGTDPSSSHGMIIPGNITFIYDTDLTEDLLIWCSVPSDCRVAFYG